jgi:TolB protein
LPKRKQSLILFVLAWNFAAIASAAEPDWPTQLIGYTELQTNLPGGRHANARTMRATVSDVSGEHRRLIAAELVDDPNAWTQFAGWSPDGQMAIVSRAWQDPENATWEEEHKQFRMQPQSWQVDANLVEIASGKTVNVTGVERVSNYNGGLFFWPGDATKLGFTALISGNSHPFRMDIDGSNKVDLTSGPSQFTYGFSSSPDGKRVAYHKNYQIYLADADGSNAVQVNTGHPFNFGPTWSPDGKWLLFVSGEHYNCHVHVVQADGSNFKKLADRGGYRGVMEFLDVPDFHGGSSDVPVWAADGQSVFHTAKVADRVELIRTALSGEQTQLTTTAAGTLHYHPTPSADGQWLLYGSKREGVRQLFVMRLADHAERQITNLEPGHGACWAHWQPRPN